LNGLIKPVVEVCEYYGTVPWRLTSRQVDKYFAGAGKRAQATVRGKITKIDGYFAFLEQRYAGEILRRFATVVESPIDQFNRPRHRGDFGLRVPPSKAAMQEFFARWRQVLPSARKYAVACRDYVMAKIAYLSGAWAAELCAVCIGDIHWSTGSGVGSLSTARARVGLAQGSGSVNPPKVWRTRLCGFGPPSLGHPSFVLDRC
jgi:integrase/recombinase XerC